MTALAILFLILSIVIVWGGLLASVTYLGIRPERVDFPPGGADDD